MAFDRFLEWATEPRRTEAIDAVAALVLLGAVAAFLRWAGA